jgi:COP9 signalosome complex subunit 1
MYLNVIKVAIESENFAHVSSYVSKVEMMPDLNDKYVIAKLKAAGALAMLASANFRRAANKFLEVSFDISTQPADVQYSVPFLFKLIPKEIP